MTLIKITRKTTTGDTKMDIKSPTNLKESVARYQELYEEQEALAGSGYLEQADIQRQDKIEADMAQLERDFPGTLDAWCETQCKKMKINQSAKSESSAHEILAFIQGDEDTTASRQDAVVSISEDGDLLFYNAACGTDDSETVLIDRMESDSMGDGWESATAADVIEWLETNCDA